MDDGLTTTVPGGWIMARRCGRWSGRGLVGQVTTAGFHLEVSVSSWRGTPSHHPFIDWDFPWNKPSSELGVPPMTMDTSICWHGRQGGVFFYREPGRVTLTSPTRSIRPHASELPQKMKSSSWGCDGPGNWRMLGSLKFGTWIFRG